MKFEPRSSTVVDVAAAFSNAAALAAERTGLAQRMREFARRVRRAGLLFIISLLGLMVFSLAVAPIPLLLWLIAVPLAGFGATLSLLWPTRRRRAPALLKASDLPPLARSARAAVARSSFQLIGEEREIARVISAQLKTIENHARGCRLDPLAEIEARRLLSEHLPRLLASYSRLSPPQQRSSEVRGHFRESLACLSSELDELCARLQKQHSDNFDTERRFVASRYGRNKPDFAA